MKTLLAFVAIGVWAFVGYSYMHRQITMPAPAGHVYAAPSVDTIPYIARSKTEGEGSDFIQLGTDEPRKFDVKIEKFAADGAKASGCFYDIPPSVTSEPENLGGVKGKWSQAGTIFIHGLPADMVDGTRWTGWLIRDGVRPNVFVGSELHTVASYRVMDAPAAVAAPSPTWAETSGHTSLDQRPRH